MSPTIDWEFVLSTIENGKCVLFVGPEAATDKEDRPLQDVLVDFLEPTNNPNILSYYEDDGLFLFKDAISKTKVYYRLKRFYQDLDVPKRYHKLTEIPFHLIITVNPDNMLCRALEDHGQSIRRLWKERELPKGEYTSGDIRFDYYLKKHNPNQFEESVKPDQPVVYNLFGSVEDEESLVLTHDDMFDFLLSILSDNQLNPEMRSALQTADDYIFLGFDFSKWYVRLLLRLLKLHNEQYKFARYASNKKLTEDIKQFCLEQFKIEFTDYEMDDFIDELHKRSKEAGILRRSGEKIGKTSDAIAKALRSDDIASAFSYMEAFFKEKDEEELLDELTGIQNRYNRAKRKISKGIIDEKESNITMNQITDALIDLNNELKDLE